MKTRTIILYWILLLVPTLLISVGAFRLLRHEQVRLEVQQIEAVRQRVRATAEDVQLAVAEWRDAVLVELENIPEADSVAALQSWQARNPLLRHTFVWQRDRGLIYPDVADGLTQDEAQFVQRYGRLFDGAVPWGKASLDEGRAAVDSVYPPAAESRVRKVRREIASLRKAAAPAVDTVSGAARIASRSGWIPWFEDNALHLLGWQSPDDMATVRGVELELTALLARVVTLFPESVANGLTLALLDDSGSVVHQAGPIIEADAVPYVSVELAPYLPHWQVAAYRPSGHDDVGVPRLFIMVSGLLLLIFVAAIVVGGVLLTWQAMRSARDARRKTTFVSNVSHELKTPLTSIRMYAELLKERRVASQEKQAHYLDVIAGESQRLTRLVNNMLDFSRLEQGRKRYRLERVDLGELVCLFVEHHRLRVEDAGMTLRMGQIDQPVIVNTDRDVIEQVLLNLVDNAVKYARDGGEIVIDLAHDAGGVVLRVMDRGPGIPVRQREQMFGVFTRGDESLTADQPGSGLGLSIARSLVRGMGGDLVCRTREGGGMIFEVTL